MGTARVEQRVYFGLWSLVGAGACLSVLGALTIGMVVAPMVAVLAGALPVTAGPSRSMSGAVSGVSLMLFFVAWTNREGPGEVCTVKPHLTECAERWNPWPWFVVGLVLLSVGIVVFYWMGRLRPSA